MSDLPLRQRSAPELVDAAFQVFRREPVAFLLAAAIVMVPVLLLQLALQPAVTAWTLRPEGGPPTAMVPAALLGLVMYAMISGASMVLARAVYLEERVDVREALRTTLRRLLPLMAVTVLLIVVVGISALPFFGTIGVLVPLTLANPTLAVIVAVGSLVFIAPIFYVFARCFALRQAVVLDGIGPLAAFDRSWALSARATGHVLGTQLLALLVGLIVVFGVGIVAGLAPSLTLVATAVLDVVIYPFVAIVDAVLYYDMRIRKEGFDIEYLARGPEAPGGGAPGAAV